MRQKKNKLPKYLYHATSFVNLGEILEQKILAPVEKRINGYDEDSISLSDMLTDYTPFYGDVVIEFRTINLFKKNEIYPFDYGIDESYPEFYDMPFWEAEWRAKSVKFDYHDINKIYFINQPVLISPIRILQEKKIKFEIISEKDLRSFSDAYYIKKYGERLKIYESGGIKNKLREIL
ncbi:hypothetical protein [Caldisericum sp.]|uniref:hypothetical protein n=1 Tax=Caldisericum sp. TaxID=2499687 RepID=UPI003D0BBD08